MIKRTLYFGNDAYLHSENNQLVIEFVDKTREKVTVPIEDIGVVILDAYRLTISRNLMSKLLDNNVAIITCDQKRMPQGLMLNLEGHHTQQERFHVQLKASLPLKKALWKQTIKQKILNQAKILSQAVMVSDQELNKMDYWARSVRSGDPDNYEARAAAFYWSLLFKNLMESFTRGRFEEPPNNLLNYAYAVLRAVTARSLVASGLLPTFGIHHRNKYNAFALADDMMEPYRPFVDKVVFNIMEEYIDEYDETGSVQMTPEVKRKLLIIPVIDVMIAGEKSPLMNAMQRTTASLYACFEGTQNKLLLPQIE